MKALTKSIAATGLLLVSSAWSYAESILLKNGTTIKGSVVEMNETDATVDTADMGRIVIKRRAIQSMTDGVDNPTSPAVAGAPANAAPSAMPLIVNNNNNNNNNNAASSAAPVVQPPQIETPAAVASSDLKQAKTASATYGEHLSAQLGFGYSKLQLTLSGTQRPRDVSDGPGIHIVPFRYKTNEGITLALVGDGMFHSGRDSNTWTKMGHAGGSVGWSSDMPSAGNAGGSWSINGTYGYGAVVTKAKSIQIESYSDSYPVGTISGYHDTSDQASSYETKVFTGALAGVNASYTYYAADGLGFDLGASALQGELENKEHKPGIDDYYDNYMDAGKRSVEAYIAYAGISKRF